MDLGPLVGLLPGERPVALLPAGRGRYDLVDPASGARRRVDPDLAATLLPDAWVLVRSLGATVAGLRELFRLGLRGTRRDLAFLLLLGGVVGAASLLLPIASKVVFNQIVPDNERSRLVGLVAGLWLVAAATALATLARGTVFVRLRTRFESQARQAGWDRLLRLPAGFFARYSVGELLNRTESLDVTRQLLTDSVVASLLNGLFALANLALVVAAGGLLAVVGTVVVLLQLALVLVFSVVQIGTGRRQLAATNRAQALVLQLLKGIAKLRVAGAERRGFGEWAALFAAQRALQMRQSLLALRTTVTTTVWPTVGTLAVVVAAAGLDRLQFTAGDYLAVTTALAQAITGVTSVGVAAAVLVQCVPYVEQLRPILDAAVEVDEAREDPGELQGRIELSRVRFRYDPDGPPVLDDVSLEVRPGEFVAVVGPSGAGKSSLMRLLLGFETPEAGTVSYDGRDLAGLDVGAVRRQIGTVLQSASLMPGTIQSNIAGGLPLSRDDAWAAAAAAGVADDIRAMPMAMETVISEGTSTLSGGQRQRIIIARALAARPRILLFDEATSALDNVTQATVSQSVARLQVSRVVIAHRLSTIEGADRIYVLQAGRVVQQGSFAELSGAPGPFADLARRQLV